MARHFLTILTISAVGVADVTLTFTKTWYFLMPPYICRNPRPDCNIQGTKLVWRFSRTPQSQGAAKQPPLSQ
ncbi:hypothetical protein B0T16DRAFT_408394 [Cercophora newfieldiana]|uniref:Uncharacterized protein n=1 Tax=Cercophora newfieldiana TaxID=92897 RepID=A0AA39YA53_9PEZI|nr:hypothetical protein B0T16DRAFT_408394 [Cercophora newfieldiana]